MKIISFAWTTEALLSGLKTCTRRSWEDTYAQTFHTGDFLQAWDQLPYVKGSKRFGTIQLTADPEWSNEYPPGDYWNEGFKWMATQGLTVNGVQPRAFWNQWLEKKPYLWIIRFELIERMKGVT